MHVVVSESGVRNGMSLRHTRAQCEVSGKERLCSVPGNTRALRPVGQGIAYTASGQRPAMSAEDGQMASTGTGQALERHSKQTSPTAYNTGHFRAEPLPMRSNNIMTARHG